MRFILAVIGIIILPSQIISETFDEQINREFYAVLNALRQRAIAISDREVADLLQYPTVSINWDSTFPGATAIHRSGNASVEVSVEMVKLFYFFSELSILVGSGVSINFEKGLKCISEYHKHIRDQVFHVFDGGSPSGRFSTYDSPEEFATIGFHCRGIENFFPLSDDLKIQRDRSVRNGIAFVVMHEIGHVVIGHRISPRSNEIRQAILCASRRQEAEADQFAVRRLVRYGFPDAVSFNSFWDLSLSVASIVPRDEIASTHPSPSRRMGESIDLAIMEARRLGADLDPRFVDLAQQLLDVQARIEEELASDDLRVQSNGC